jgi:hypothetical protein
MMPKRAIAIALLVSASLPAFGERLLFEGTFDSLTPCGKAEGCREPSPIEPIPISFTIDVNDISSESRSVSDQWLPPRLSPTLLTQSTFESLIDGRVESRDLQTLWPKATGWTWTYSTGREWSGGWSDEPSITATYFEGRGLSIEGSGDGAVTFADLVATFDTYLASGTPIAISQQSGFQLVSFEGAGLESISEIFTGSVRLTSITCRVPSRVGAMMANAVQGFRGAS